jgi:hypothetical protein
MLRALGTGRCPTKISRFLDGDGLKHQHQRKDTSNALKMGGAGITGRTRPTKVKKQAAAGKRKRDDVDVEKLEAAVAALVSCRDAM